MSDDGTTGWKNKTGALTYLLKEADVGKFFRSNSIAIDSIEQELWYESEAIGPVVAPLVVATPVATGEPTVGETLTCAEPAISGGSDGPFQIGYYWVDETNAMIWERQYQNQEMVLTEDQIGKTYKCLVTVTDKGFEGGETVTVESNEIGPVVAAREPITVTMAAKWADLNDYTVGQTVFADTAGFAGGLEDTTTYRWRVQTRATADGSIINGTWTNYSDHAEEVSVVLEEAGQIRFQCQARDSGVDPAEQVNSFANWKDVAPLPTTIGDITIKVLDSVYDWENPTTLTVLMNDDINIVTTISGDANPTYKYTVRDTDMEYEIKPPESAPNMGNGPDIIYIPKTAGLHTVSISISDSTATDDGDNYPGVQLWAVDAKTWAELQAKKND